MDSFSAEGDKLRNAQEAFRSNFQAGIYHRTPDTNNRDEGAQTLVTCKHCRTITDVKKKSSFEISTSTIGRKTGMKSRPYLFSPGVLTCWCW